jgi:hypothetical protein
MQRIARLFARSISKGMSDYMRKVLTWQSRAALGRSNA